MNASDTSQTKRWKEIFTEKYLRRLMNQNGEHLVSLCESDTFETQVIFPILARTLLARTLFPVKSTNNIK